MPSLIPIYRFDFLCIFYFIIAYFFIVLFTIQLKRKDGSVGSPPIEGTRLADQSRKHPFAQLNSLSLNINFNLHQFHAHSAFLFRGKGLMEDAISKMMGRPKPRAEPGAEADEREAAQRLSFLRMARREEHLLSKRALLARRQQHPLPRNALLLQLQVLLLLHPLRPTATGPAVEKRLTNERCAVPRHAVSKEGGPRQAQPRARRETEIKFTLGLLTSVQCAENVGTKFTQEMQSFRKVCSLCDQKQKKFTQQVKTLRNSLHVTGQS